MPVCCVSVKGSGGKGGAIFVVCPFGNCIEASFVSGKSEISTVCPDSIPSKEDRKSVV